MWTSHCSEHRASWSGWLKCSLVCTVALGWDFPPFPGMCSRVGFPGSGSFAPAVPLDSVHHSFRSLVWAGLHLKGPGRGGGGGIRLTFAPRGPSQGGRWPQMEQSQLLAARAGVLILGLSHPSGCPRPALYWRPGICCCRGWCVRLYRPPQRGSKDSVARGEPGGV